MRKSRILTAIVFFLAILWAQSSGAVEMQATPIQQQMEAEVTSVAWLADDDFDVVPEDQPPVNGREGKKVSVVKAAMLSALLPGLGEYYTGHRTKAKYFFGAEAATWAGFIAFRTYGGWKKDDLIRFAAANAGASLDGKDDEFLDWVGFYPSIDDFNTLGRVSDPDRPYLEDTPENHWLWLSESDQEAYRDLKNSSREAYRRANFMIGVAIVNRLISVIDSIRDAKRASRRIDDSFTDSRKLNYKLSVNPFSASNQIRLTIYTPL